MDSRLGGGVKLLLRIGLHGKRPNSVKVLDSLIAGRGKPTGIGTQPLSEVRTVTATVEDRPSRLGLHEDYEPGGRVSGGRLGVSSKLKLRRVGGLLGFLGLSATGKP